MAPDLPPAFDMEAHRQYVETRGCPYVDTSGTWCNGRSDDLHQDHWALYLLSTGDRKRVQLRNWQRIDHG